MKYKGYEIWTSVGGGKAGTNRNVTATVQVRERLQPPNYLLKKQIRYKVNDHESMLRAIEKAKKFIDELVVKDDAQVTAKADAGAQDAH